MFMFYVILFLLVALEGRFSTSVYVYLFLFLFIFTCGVGGRSGGGDERRFPSLTSLDFANLTSLEFDQRLRRGLGIRVWV
jgi:hypothetical protein